MASLMAVSKNADSITQLIRLDSFRGITSSKYNCWIMILNNLIDIYGSI